MITPKFRREEANSLYTLFPRDLLKNTKIIVADRRPAFRSGKFWKYFKMSSIAIPLFTAYNPEANGPVESVIRIIKQYIKLHFNFQSGCKCILDGAVQFTITTSRIMLAFAIRRTMHYIDRAHGHRQDHLLEVLQKVFCCCFFKQQGERETKQEKWS